MKFFRLLMNLMVLLTLPALIFPQEPRIPFEKVVTETFLSQKHKSNRPLFTYDEMLGLLVDIESENTDKYSDQDLAKINHLLCFLAREGLLSDDANKKFKLEQDIHDLLSARESSLSFAFNYDEEWMAVPAVYFGGPDVMLCRSWFKKKWDSTRKFVKKHKTEIIIGAIVVGAVVAVAVVAGVAAGGAVAAGAAGATLNNEDGSSQQDYPTYDYPSESYQESQTTELEATIPVDPVVFQETVRDSVDSFKKMVVEDNLLPESVEDPTFLDTARQMGSYLAHETLDAISQIISIVPETLNEVESAATALGVTGILNSDSSEFRLPDPVQSYEEMIAAGHEQIDKLFSTNQACRYEQTEEKPLVQFSYGILPPPGLSNDFFADAKILAEAGKASDRAGLTKAGRGLMKHGYREGSSFPKPVGNPTQINEHGQRVLETIINHPEKKIIHGEYTRYGKVVDIVAPEIGGVRYDINGNFIGFLEP